MIKKLKKSSPPAKEEIKINLQPLPVQLDQYQNRMIEEKLKEKYNFNLHSEKNTNLR